MSNLQDISISFEDDEKHRIELFISQVHHFLSISLTQRQQKILLNFYVLQIFKEYGLTVNGYLSFIQVINELQKLTKLPFSLESDIGGLGSQKEFHTVVQGIYQIEKRNDKRRKRRANK